MPFMLGKSGRVARPILKKLTPSRDRLRPTDTVCYHAQQCVEKYIKALLVFRATPFPKTHNIRVLSALLPPKFRPKLDSDAQDRLTRYATVLRYPGAGPDVPLPEARNAVVIARRVRKEVRRHLPRAALRRERK
jgi:HEPN domain-containing protein